MRSSKMRQGKPTDRLFKAAKTNDIKKIIEEIKSGVDVNSKDEKQRTPLPWAAGNGPGTGSRLLSGQSGQALLPSAQ